MLLLGDVEECVLVDGRCWPLTFQLEHHDTTRDILVGSFFQNHGGSTYLSWPAANRLISGCAAITQNLSFSLLKLFTGVRLFKSQTRIVLSSPAERMRSW